MADVHIHPKALIFDRSGTMEKRKGTDGLPQKIYFSRMSAPEEFPEMRRVTIKPRWLMTAVLWALRKLGFTVHDMREIR